MTVEAIRRQSFTDWELIVVGQGHDPDIVSLAHTLPKVDRRIRYIHLQQKGLSRARNAAICASRGEWIAMTDDDCEPASDWLAVIAEYFRSERDIGVIGGSLIAPPGPSWRLGYCPGHAAVEAVYDPFAMRRTAPPGWDWVGGNFAVLRDHVERIGLFDEYLGAGADFPAGEDTDYKLRAEALGIKMASTPRSVVRHTYGWRFGVRAVFRHLSAYSRGNGGLAGKLTLLGDPRGLEWVENEWCIFKARAHRIDRLPLAINRWQHFKRGYRECVSKYDTDNQGMLRPNALRS